MTYDISIGPLPHQQYRLTLPQGETIQSLYSAAVQRGPSGLELAPARPAYLRAVADPWAHVFVDGQRVDTTPFARAIPLRAGTHYVRFEHPNAPTERRTITLVAGETVLLDVKMRVSGAAPIADAGSAAREPDTGPPSP